MAAGFATSDCFFGHKYWRTKITLFKYNDKGYKICWPCEKLGEIEHRIDFEEKMDKMGNPPYASA